MPLVSTVRAGWRCYAPVISNAISCDDVPRHLAAVKSPARRADLAWPGYPAVMSTSPLDPQEIRAAAEVYRELGPEYSDAVVAAFIDRVDRAVAARVEARLAEERAYQPEVRDNRRTLLKGVALGICASALVAGVGISQTHAVGQGGQAKVFPQQGIGPGKGGFPPAPIKLKPGTHVPKPAAPPPPPAAT
jgi:hypothetical protein